MLPTVISIRNPLYYLHIEATFFLSKPISSVSRGKFLKLPHLPKQNSNGWKSFLHKKTLFPFSLGGVKKSLLLLLKNRVELIFEENSLQFPIR